MSFYSYSNYNYISDRLTVNAESCFLLYDRNKSLTSSWIYAPGVQTVHWLLKKHACYMPLLRILKAHSRSLECDYRINSKRSQPKMKKAFLNTLYAFVHIILKHHWKNVLAWFWGKKIEHSLSVSELLEYGPLYS